jgi:hypothetical protein
MLARIKHTCSLLSKECFMLSNSFWLRINSPRSRSFSTKLEKNKSVSKEHEELGKQPH